MSKFNYRKAARQQERREFKQAFKKNPEEYTLKEDTKTKGRKLL